MGDLAVLSIDVAPGQWIRSIRRLLMVPHDLRPTESYSAEIYKEWSRTVIVHRQPTPEEVVGAVARTWLYSVGLMTHPDVTEVARLLNGLRRKPMVVTGGLFDVPGSRRRW